MRDIELKIPQQFWDKLWSNSKSLNKRLFWREHQSKITWMNSLVLSISFKMTFLDLKMTLRKISQFRFKKACKNWRDQSKRNKQGPSVRVWKTLTSHFSSEGQKEKLLRRCHQNFLSTRCFGMSYRSRQTSWFGSRWVKFKRLFTSKLCQVPL